MVKNLKIEKPGARMHPGRGWQLVKGNRAFRGSLMMVKTINGSRIAVFSVPASEGSRFRASGWDEKL
jgi:hypothetical protein